MTILKYPYLCRHSLFKFVAVLLFLFKTVSLSARVPQYLHFINYNSAHGLLDDFAEAVFVDSEGLLWIATHNGLASYDGVKFSNYERSQDNRNGLTSNKIQVVFEDHESRLWIGTAYGGLLQFDRSRRIFTPVSFMRGETVMCIDEDIHNNLWVCTLSGVFKISGGGTSFIKIVPGVASRVEQHEIQIRAIHCSSAGDVWLGLNQKDALYKLDDSGRKFLQVDGGREIQYVQTIAEDTLGDIWLGTSYSGIGKLNSSTGEINWLPIKTLGKVDKEIEQLYFDNHNRLWYGTINSGLGVIDVDGMETSFSSDPFDQYSLPSNTVKSITQDKEGNYWIASPLGGVAQFKIVEGGFVHYKMKQNDPLGLSSNVIACFAEDADGGIWIGTDGGGLNYFDSQNDTFHSYGTASGLNSNVVLTILPLEGKLLYSGWEQGVCSFNIKERKSFCKTTELFPEQIRANNIKALFIDNEKNLWAGNHSLDGIDFYDIETLTRNDKRSEFLRSAGFDHAVWVNQIVQDTRGFYWIASDRGLFQYKDTFIHYSHNQDDSLSITSNNVTTIFEDNTGRLWVGTNDGLLEFDYLKKNFIDYSLKYDLPRSIKSILDDDFGNLWISTKAGLLRFNPETATKDLFDVHSGLQGNVFFERSCLKSSTGELFFGGLNGFTRFSPDKVCTFREGPIVKLTDFTVFNKSEFANIRQDGLGTYFVDILPDWSVISFEYAALSYWAPSQNKYAYILEGFDSEWHYADNEHKATYTNLDPGEYTLQIKAANEIGVWNEKGIRVEITILPPFWMTWWFKLLLSFSILSFFAFIYFWRVRVFQLQKIRLEYEVRKRTHELKHLNTDLVVQKEEVELQNEQLEAQKRQLEEYNDAILRKTGEVLLQREKITDQNLELATKNKELDDLVKTKDKFFSIIAHDLKNPINAIMGFSELMLRRFEHLSDEKKHDFVTHINLSANLIYNLLVNLLDWARSQSHNLQVKKKDYILINVFADNIALMSDLALSKGIKLSMDVDKKLVAHTDINILNTILRNLMSNAIKFTMRNGNVHLSATVADRNLINVSVQDTGLGMSEEKVSTLFEMDKNTSTNGTEHEKGTGLGLLVVKEFVLANGGEIFVKSNLGSGTTFTFTLIQGGIDQ